MIVAFDGLQPLDAVGPHEVFSGAGRAAAALGRAGSYRVTLASPGGATVRAESGLVLGTAPLPDGTRSASTPWCSPAGPAPRRRPATRPCSTSSAARPRAAGAWPPSARAPSWARRPGCSTGAASPRTGPAPANWPRTYPGVTVDADPIYVRDGKYWSSAGVTAGIDLSLALVQEDLGVDVAQTVARWLVMFLHRPGGQTQFASAGVGPPRRALDHPGRAVRSSKPPRRRPPAARPRRRGGHERPALHPGLHRRGGRDPEPLRRAHPAGGRPPRARGDDRHARRGGGALRARQRRVACAACSSATSACHPTPTGGASAPHPEKGHPHDRPPADRHPTLPEVHRARCRRPLRGPAADPDLRHRLRRPRARRGAQ